VKGILAAGLLAGALVAGAPAGGCAQQTQQAQAFLPTGTEAPDVSFTAATRYGMLAEPVRLSQFHGQTVVIAFFFRARSPG
jgi:peroxiredoxin